MQHRKNIIIRRSGALGDVLLASGLLPSIIANHNSPICITFVTNAPQILENNPHIDKIVTTMPVLNKDDIFYDLDMSYEMHPEKTIFEAYADVVKTKPINIDLTYYVSEELKFAARRILKERDINPQKTIAIHSSSNSWARNVKPILLESIVYFFQDKLGINFILLGVKKDPMINGAIDLRDIGSINLSAAIMNECKAFIGIDSTLIHFAKALNKPVAGFFGPTDPTLRLQFSENDLIFTSGLPCQFCHHRLRPPAFITICNKDPFSFCFDSIWQNMIRAKSNLFNNYGCRLMSKMSQCRNKGRWIPKCMKYDSKTVIQKIEPWFKRLF